MNKPVLFRVTNNLKIGGIQRRLERVDATLRALLRCGAWELRSKPEVPREIVIDEYVELAKAFFDEAEAKFVNAALDGVARDVRAS